MQQPKTNTVYHMITTVTVVTYGPAIITAVRPPDSPLCMPDPAQWTWTTPANTFCAVLSWLKANDRIVVGACHAAMDFQLLYV